MAKLEKYVPKDRPAIVDNVYTAKIISIDRKEWAPDNITLNWKFELSQPPFLGARVWVWGTTGISPTPKARLTAWGETLGYSREQLANDFDTEVMVGSFVKVLVKTWQKENGESKQGVTELLPLTEADNQLLQIWLKEANTTGQIKVAVQAPVAAPAAVAPVAVPVPAPQPVVTHVAQNQPAVKVAVPPVTRRSTDDIPF